MPLKPPYSNFRAWFIDMDGVIYRGTHVLPGAPALIAALQQGGNPYLFLTNNATKTPDQSVARLAKIGINVPASAIFSSALATAAYLVQHFPPPLRLIVVGGDGIRQAVDEAGYERVARAEEAQLVVSGLDQSVDYAQMAEAALAINAACPWIATNADPTWPGERGDMPGAGALIALLEASTGQKPLAVIGKPELGIFEQALARLGVSAANVVMLGDRLGTDILGGHRAGLRTILTLTGASTLAEAQTFDPRPDFIIPDLTALLEQ